VEKSGHFTGKNKLKSHPQRYYKVDLGIVVDLYALLTTILLQRQQGLMASWGGGVGGEPFELISSGKWDFSQWEGVDSTGVIRHRTKVKVRMLDFKMNIYPMTVHDSHSDWREKDHGELVFSLSLAFCEGELAERCA
jgi:hypothetical protein